MLKKIIVGATLFALSLSSQAMAAQKIVNGIDANFPPFAYIDETGKPAGFDVEAMNLIAKELGMELQHKPIEWSGIVTSLLNKKVDIIASGMSITKEREEKVNFSTPYWVIKQVMVTKKDSPLTVNQLLTEKKLVGVQQGTSEAKWIKEEAEKNGWNVELRFYDSSPLAIEDVLNGRIHAAAMDDAPAMDAASKKPVQIVGTFGMPDEKFGYAIRKEDKELLDQVNEGLENLKASPEWKKLVEKYGLNK